MSVLDERISRAPWTPEQVVSLNDYQRCDDVHPFTCGQCSAALKAYMSGWKCPCGCGCTQDWAHWWMADGHWQQMLGFSPETRTL